MNGCQFTGAPPVLTTSKVDTEEDVWLDTWISNQRLLTHSYDYNTTTLVFATGLTLTVRAPPLPDVDRL